ncbi:ATP-binding protein [Kitasatospora sp. NPDC058218]|uniref:ATP-binding protein n=1 Tax=Kitasatospora sp. NPDC058218 TaxID=3346385 RepID=UPI0036D7BCE7
MGVTLPRPTTLSAHTGCGRKQLLRPPVTAIAEPTIGELTESAALYLPYQPESVGRARRLVREVLTEWGLLHLIDTAALVTSELVTNATKTGCHRRMTVSVTLVTDATVRISVRDGSRCLPVLLPASDDDECHRGLALVHQLTGGRWGVTVEPFGKVVHADVAR